MKQYSGIGSLN